MIADVLLTRTAVLAAAMTAVLSLPVEASDFGGFNGGFNGGFHGGFNGGNTFFRHRAILGSSFNHRFDGRRNIDLRRGFVTGRDRLLPIDRRDFARDRLLPIDRRDFRHADFAGSGRFVYDGMGFTEANRFRPTRIDQLGGSSYSNGGSSVMVIVSNRPDYDTFGTHAGSAYGGGGGAYVVSSGYPLYGDAAPAGSQSGAKIINVAKTHSACSYEHGVCVIRP